MIGELAGPARGLCDGHVHVGFDPAMGSFPPEWVARGIRALGLERCVVSSVTGATGDAAGHRADDDLQTLAALIPGVTIPLLWLTRDRPGISERVDLPPWYRGFKVHPYAQSWDPNDPHLHQAFRTARERCWPVLMHTGWTPESQAGRFAALYQDFPDVTVILAHGRPLDESIGLALSRERIFVDTAYMSQGEIRAFLQGCGHSRLIFGSDFPVDRHYFPRASAVRRYARRVAGLMRCFGEDAVRTWAHDNFINAYGT